MATKRKTPFLERIFHSRNLVLKTYVDKQTANESKTTLNRQDIVGDVLEKTILVRVNGQPRAEERYYLSIHQEDAIRASQILKCKIPQRPGMKVCPNCASANYFYPNKFFDSSILGIGHPNNPGRLRVCRVCKFEWRRFNRPSW